jgi:hypothetical protein
MIEVKIFKMQSSGYTCDNPTCKRNPKYFDQILSTYYLKQDVVVAKIRMGGVCQLYCTDCIDYVKTYLISKFDKKLWVFNED